MFLLTLEDITYEEGKEKEREREKEREKERKSGRWYSFIMEQIGRGMTVLYLFRREWQMLSQVK